MEAHNLPSTADASPLNAAFRLLSDRRRRYAVAVVSERAAPISLTELAERVAARETETETDADEAPSRRTEVVAVALHHTHLPKLADAGVVAYDVDSETVIPAEIEPLEPLLAAPGDAPGTPEGPR